MNGQVCADALFQLLGTASLKLRTIHGCTLDAIQIHGRVRSTLLLTLLLVASDGSRTGAMLHVHG